VIYRWVNFDRERRVTTDNYDNATGKLRVTSIRMKLAKTDAADVTADKSVGAGNIKPIAPLNSAMKNGLQRLLWCYLSIVHMII